MIVIGIAASCQLSASLSTQHACIRIWPIAMRVYPTRLRIHLSWLCAITQAYICGVTNKQGCSLKRPVDYAPTVQRLIDAARDLRISFGMPRSAHATIIVTRDLLEPSRAETSHSGCLCHIPGSCEKLIEMAALWSGVSLSKRPSISGKDASATCRLRRGTILDTHFHAMGA